MSFSSSNQRHFATRFQKDRCAGQVRTRGHRAGGGHAACFQGHMVADWNGTTVRETIPWFNGLNMGRSPENMARNMVITNVPPWLRILKISHWLVNYQGIPHFQTHLHILGPNVGVLAANVLSWSKNIEFFHGFCWLRPTAWLQLWRKTTKHGQSCHPLSHLLSCHVRPSLAAKPFVLATPILAQLVIQSSPYFQMPRPHSQRW